MTRHSNQTTRLVSLEVAGEYLGISIWSVRTLIHTGSLPVVRIGRRLLVDRADLDQFIEQRKEVYQ